MLTVTSPDSLFGRVLEARLLRLVGHMSYSLYLWQQLFFPPIEGGAATGRLGQFALRVVAVFVAAGCSYFLIEKPAIRMGHIRARTSAAAVVPLDRGIPPNAAAYSA
jgi:peptidoglycan/LPS O-acetylase OafA/YrhL